jgi:FANCL UBC-like domain 3
LESIGYSHLSSVNESNLGLIQLKVDSNAGTHFLDLNVESAILIKCQCGDLPEKAVSVITQQASCSIFNLTIEYIAIKKYLNFQCSSILKAFESFKAQISKLQLFWRVVREIDEETWILDPLEPNLSHNRRQICIGSSS